MDEAQLIGNDFGGDHGVPDPQNSSEHTTTERAPFRTAKGVTNSSSRRAWARYRTQSIIEMVVVQGVNQSVQVILNFYQG